jgi:hypothetical protein
MFGNQIQAMIEGALLPQGWMLHSRIFIPSEHQESLGLMQARPNGAPSHCTSGFISFCVLPEEIETFTKKRDG